MKSDPIRYVSTLAFAMFVFGLGFYALVLYDFALPELIQGAFISFMTLAVQWVFGSDLATQVGRRASQAFQQGIESSPTVTATAGPPATVTAEPSHTTTEPTSTTTSRG